MNDNLIFLAECADLRNIHEDNDHYQYFADMIVLECLNMIHCAVLTGTSHDKLDQQIRDYFGVVPR